MNTAAPIELNLYNDQDEVIDTLRRTRIPSYLLDMAIELQKKMSGDANGSPNSDALFDFISEFYNKKMTREEIKKQTDLIECMAVLQSIIARASGLAREFAKANPPGPSPKKK